MLDTDTVQDLYILKRITDEQLEAAVTDFLNDPKPSPRPLAEGVANNVCAIMAADPHAQGILAAEHSSEADIHAAVRTAILLAPVG
ncbi:hypothetical protein EU555_04780 [Methylobacterium nonmethylotrophicum]|uniref:Uncharacterized protein n=2 Tax=Methylobacterium nonmethylotrophicum TaxID=1141884 RepID=A0A4Z0NV62_9HYPH|nr:hypothetical protein [Methylobacterium nonmethylotrophicum]TGE01482.1 hypothetical protein EU555_04780 [Methylobacterium nonmethylotrophicum]